MDKKIELAIGPLLDFLNRQQKKDGSFSSENTFHTSLILLSLEDLRDDPIAKKIIGKGLKFLLGEKHSNWTWNYWRSGVPKYPPDDWDDTACALAAISIYRPEKINGEILSTLTKLLVQCELKEGGPYSTWIVPKKLKRKWADCDVVVNSNIAYLLSLHEVSLPNLSRLAESFIKEKTKSSKYYLSEIIILYFISRFYKGELRNLVRQRLQKRMSQSNILEKALMVSAWLNFDGEPKKVVTVIKELAKEKTWVSYPLYIEENPGEPHYSGSPALTAAFILEALIKYREALKRTEKLSKILTRERKAALFHSKMVATLGRRAAEGGQKKEFNAVVAKIIQNDPGRQITLLPYFFRDSLKSSQKISDNLVFELGKANLAGWIAYKIYDDFLDNEGNPLLLSLANFCLREVTIIYKDILSTDDFQIFTKMMNKLERANSLPTYSNYEVLADKSLAHSLGPITILLHLGYEIKHSEMKKLISFFRYYLIARQLNDDAHDWSEDLGRGFINAAAEKIIKIWQVQERSRKLPVLKNEEEKLQLIFWHKVILKLAEDIYDHLEKAEKIIKSMRILKTTDYFLSLLTPLKTATNKAVADRKKMIQFLKNY